MEQSHLIRSLRITFLTVGFLTFVFTVAHWVQHLSTARPVLTPQIISTIQTGGLADKKSNVDIRESSIVSFVRSPSFISSDTGLSNGHSPGSDTVRTPSDPQNNSRSSSQSLDLNVVNDTTEEVKDVLKPNSSLNRGHVPHNTAP